MGHERSFKDDGYIKDGSKTFYPYLALDSIEFDRMMKYIVKYNKDPSIKYAGMILICARKSIPFFRLNKDPMIKEIIKRSLKGETSVTSIHFYPCNKNNPSILTR